MLLGTWLHPTIIRLPFGHPMPAIGLVQERVLRDIVEVAFEIATILTHVRG